MGVLGTIDIYIFKQVFADIFQIVLPGYALFGYNCLNIVFKALLRI